MIDVETLINDKKLLQEEIKQLKSELKDWQDLFYFVKNPLYDVLLQRSNTNLADEVKRFMEASGYIDDGK